MKKLFFLLIFLFCPLLTQAHPHVWVDSALSLESDQTQIIKLHLVWEFDEMMSASLMQTLDQNHDGKISPAEVKAAKGDVNKMAEFVHIWINDKPINNLSIADFKSYYQDEKVTYEFSIPVHAGLNDKLDIGIYDPEYYVDLGEKPTLDKTKPLPENYTCQKVKRPEKVYFNLVETWALSCKSD